MTVTEEQAICSYKFFCGGVSYYVPGSETEEQNGMDMKVSNARYAKMLNASSSATITKGLSVYKNTYKQQIARKLSECPTTISLLVEITSLLSK